MMRLFILSFLFAGCCCASSKSDAPMLIFPPESEPPLLILPPEPVPTLFTPEGETEPIVSIPEVSEEQIPQLNQILQVPLAEGSEVLPEITPPDNTTIVTYTVKMWYTQEVEDAIPELQGFFDQVIDDTNQGYINSDIPLRVEMLCAEKIGVVDSGSIQTILSTFSSFGLSVLKDTADTATLFVTNSDYCTYGYSN